MKIKVPLPFQSLELTDRQLVFAELVYNLTRHYKRNYKFQMYKTDVRFLTREPGTGKNGTSNNLTKLYNGLIEIVDVTDDKFFVYMTMKYADKQKCFEHELTDIDAIKINCYLMGRINSDIYDDSFEKSIQEKTVKVGRNSNVISPYQLQQLDVTA